MDNSGRCFITEVLSAIFMPKIEYRTSLLRNEERFFYFRCQLSAPFSCRDILRVVDADKSLGIDKYLVTDERPQHGVALHQPGQRIAVRGLLAKISQNADLKKQLMDTKDAYIVECAHSDKIWACGIRLNESERFDASKWQGQNILGFALMEVRSMLKC